MFHINGDEIKASPGEGFGNRRLALGHPPREHSLTPPHFLFQFSTL
jgi:hypothetical protein